MSETTERSFIAHIWYGDDEDSFLVATARNIPVFVAGGLFMVPLWSMIKKSMDRSKDPTGQKRINDIKKDVAAHGVSSPMLKSGSSANTTKYAL